MFFTSLGMTKTRLRFADFERRPNRAFGHVKVGDSFQPKYQRLLDPQSPAGGLVRRRTVSPDGWRWSCRTVNPKVGKSFQRTLPKLRRFAVADAYAMVFFWRSSAIAASS
jgi:hypothetical protein